MSTETKIEWTRGQDGTAGKTWNPVVGCEPASPGCDHCYAGKLAAGRLAHLPLYAGLTTNGQFNGKVKIVPERLKDPLRWRKPSKIFVNSMSDLFHQDIPDEFIAKVFAVMALTPQHTFQILTKRHGRMRSLLSSERWRELLYEALSWAVGIDLPIPAERFTEARKWVYGSGIWSETVRPLPNVWLGVSVEDQKRADLRIPALLETPAAVRWISAEPLLGPVDLVGPVDKHGGRPRLTYWLDGRPGWSKEGEPVGDSGLTLHSMETGPRIDWVVVGGETGPGARPMHPQWARTIRDQCVDAGVPFWFKQWGAWGPAPWVVRVCDPKIGWKGTDAELVAAKADAEARGATHVYASWAHLYGHELYEPPYKPWSVERADPLDAHQAPMRRWGKKRAGKVLDGREWEEFPA